MEATDHKPNLTEFLQSEFALGEATAKQIAEWLKNKHPNSHADPSLVLEKIEPGTLQVKPCPPDCKFDWVKFHENLDIALAHIIQDATFETPGVQYMPSIMPTLTLMQYSDAKVKYQKGEIPR